MFECLWPPFRAGKGPSCAGPKVLLSGRILAVLWRGWCLLGGSSEGRKIAVGKALSTDAKKTRELFIFF